MKTVYSIAMGMLLVVIFATAPTRVHANEKSCKRLAMQFRVAVNKKDPSSLSKLFKRPSYSVMQQWDFVGGKDRFVLTKITPHRIHNIKQALLFAKYYIKRVEVEGDKAEFVPLSKYGEYKKEMTVGREHWKKLNTWFLWRGQGDVGHVILLGLDVNCTKIERIYTN